MAAAELTASALRAFAVLCAATIAAAAMTVAGPLHAPAVSLLAQFGLDPRPRTPALHTLLVDRLATNLRAAALPALLAAIGMARHPAGRRVGDALVAAMLAVNAALVGAAFATTGLGLVCYLPHLPVEWAALAVATVPWQIARRRQAQRRDYLVPLIAVLGLLVVAAVMETYLTPRPE